MNSKSLYEHLSKHILAGDKNVSNLRNTLSLNQHWHNVIMDPIFESHLTLDIDKENFDGIVKMIRTYSSANRFRNLKHLEVEANDEQMLKVSLVVEIISNIHKSYH